MNEPGALSHWEPYRSGPSMFVIDKGCGAPVCRVMFGGWTTEERESVANLIAAAPNLLNACRIAVMALAAAAERDQTFQRDYEAVSAAIEKARGEA